MAHTKTTNFMNGVSFEITPLTKLKIISASSIFGEPSYYRDSDAKVAAKLNTKGINMASVKKHLLFTEMYDGQTTVDIFTKAIDDALDYNFEATLKFATILREKYYMRLNPSIIFIRASIHPKRAEFNKTHPKFFREIGDKVIGRPDDMTNQLKYYLAIKGSKHNLPVIIKRTWCDQLEKMDRYRAKKYLNTGKLIDLVRICHAHSPIIDEMMKSGEVKVSEEEKTWETLRAGGMKWSDILKTIRIPHMALLRNLRGMSTEINEEEMTKVLDWLVKGVQYGKQFPFRYYSAYNAIETNSKFRNQIKNTLEKCINVAMQNFPTLEGKTICLSDNSGSAWGSFNSSYGSVTVADIANLSSVMTAFNCTEGGEVGLFGDTLLRYKIDKDKNILEQHREVTKIRKEVGAGTENGIWIFFREAIAKKQHYDNIFIYSDMQAGHGGLYGLNHNEYKNFIFAGKSWAQYIDVLQLVQKYRDVVNPKVNVFTVQVGGYDNNILPETIYRGAILTGWTGNETTYAKALINIWNTMENKEDDLLMM
jgi:hypothetical protein